MTWNYHSPEKPLEHNPYPQLMSERWLRANVKTNHGPLTAAYPLRNVSEGDTPAFLNLIDNGLRAYENPDFGGWGGRYRPSDGNFWIDAPDDNSRHKSLWRWVPAAQNDFAARADWCVKTFDDANHPPAIENAIQPAAVKPGQTVELSADASDPDGDAVHYFWWHYPDPSGMTEPLRIDHETAREARFVVPENASGAIHVILELSDDGEPILRRYRRLVFPVVR